MRRVLLIAATTVAVLSCSGEKGPTEPDEFSGNYRLESINAQPLPFIDLIAALTGDTLYIVSGDLSVLSNGRVRIVFRRRWHPRNAPPQLETTDSIVRPYQVEGDFAYVDHQTGGLEGPYTDTIEVYDDALTLRQLVNRYNAGHFWRNVYYIRN